MVSSIIMYIVCDVGVLYTYDNIDSICVCTIKVTYYTL